MIDDAITGVHLPQDTFSIGNLSYLSLCSNVLSEDTLKYIQVAA